MYTYICWCLRGVISRDTGKGFKCEGGCLEAHACFQPLRGVCAQLKGTTRLQSESSSLPLPLLLCLSASLSLCTEKGGGGNAFILTHQYTKGFSSGKKKTLVTKCE